MSVYKLLGSPSGSAEYAEGGVLTTPVREHPFSLILLDEIEKASSDVLNIFLQLLEDGRVTENTGRTVHFTNCIIIATSNAGSKEIVELLKKGLAPDTLPKQVLNLLEKYFKPEFINRFDGVIPFHALTKPEIEQVVELLLTQVSQRMQAQGYTLTFTPDCKTQIADTGFDPVYGARPLRRLIQDKVEALLAQYIIDGTIKPGQTLQITAEMIQ